MRKTKEERQAEAFEALDRAQNGQSWANFPAIIEGFAARGIPESEIIPRVNVFTYRAWQAKGRQVMKGEKGVKVETYVPMTVKDEETGEEKSIGRRPRNATVFHVSQTKELDA